MRLPKLCFRRLCLLAVAVAAAFAVAAAEGDAVPPAPQAQPPRSVVFSSVTHFSARVQWWASLTQGASYEVSCFNGSSSFVTTDAFADCCCYESATGVAVAVRSVKDGYSPSSYVASDFKTLVSPVKQSAAAVQAGATWVSVSWQASNTTGPLRYSVVCSEGKSNAYCGRQQVGVTQAIFTNLQPSRRYSFWIYAERRHFYSSDPAVIHADTLDASATNQPPTDYPTEEPTDTSTEEPTDTSTEEPTDTSTEEPDTPTEEPDTPTEEPTDTPTEEPTEDPGPTGTPPPDVATTLLPAVQPPRNVWWNWATHFSVTAAWHRSPTAGASYEIFCNSSSSSSSSSSNSSSSSSILTNSTSATCCCYESATEFPVSVRAVKDGYRPSGLVTVTARTTVAPVNASSVSVQAGTSWLSLSWQAPNTTGPLRYSVWCIDARNGSYCGSQYTNVTQATLAGLQPSSAYRVRIDAWKNYFYPSITTVNATTLHESRLQPPTALSAKAAGEQSLQISWQKSATAGARYEIRCGGSTIRTNGTRTVCCCFPSGSENSVSVRAVMRGHSPSDSVTALGRTAVAAVSAASVSVVSGRDWVSVRWEESQTVGEVRYRALCAGNGSHQLQRTAAPSAEFRGLRRNQRHRIFIWAVKSGFPDSHAVSVAAVTNGTNQTEPPAAPVSLSASPLNGSCLQVTWRAANGSAEANASCEFELRCPGARPAARGRLLFGACCGLASGERHRVVVAAVRLHSDAAAAEAAAAEATAAVTGVTPLQPPPRINISPLGGGCLHATWPPSPSAGVGFLLRCPWAAPQFLRRQRAGRCCGLRPAAAFTVAVESLRAGFNNSAAAAAVGRTALCDITAAHSSPVNASCVQAWWSSACDSVSGLSFRVACPRAAEADTRGMRAAVCCGLPSGDSHSITVTAVKPGFTDSNSVTITAVTELQAPPSGHADRLNSSCAQVTWAASASAAAWYQLQCPGRAAGSWQPERIGVCCDLRLRARNFVRVRAVRLGFPASSFLTVAVGNVTATAAAAAAPGIAAPPIAN